MLGLLRRKPVEELVFAAVHADGADYFLQIGANDGQYTDPLNLAINRTSLRGTLVEPHPGYFEKLKCTYKSIDGLTYVNAGVSDGEGEIVLYTFDPDDRSIPAWLHGSSSFDKSQVVRNARRVPGAEGRIQKLPVQLISVDALLRRCAKAPSVIVVDAEGYDAMILRQFDFNANRPVLVIYESESMSTRDAEEIEAIFRSHSYHVVALGQDTIAIRADAKMLASVSLLESTDKFSSALVEERASIV